MSTTQKTPRIDRQTASQFNPLVGISPKDTRSLVTGALRDMATSTLDPRLVAILSDLAAAALEFEEGDD